MKEVTKNEFYLEQKVINRAKLKAEVDVLIDKLIQAVWIAHSYSNPTSAFYVLADNAAVIRQKQARLLL